MLGVIIDKNLGEINEFTNCETILNFKLFNKCLLDYQIEELSSIGINNIIIISDKSPKIKNENIVLLKNKKEIINFFNKEIYEKIYLFPGNAFFEINILNDNFLQNYFKIYNRMSILTEIENSTNLNEFYNVIFNDKYFSNNSFDYFKFINNTNDIKLIFKDFLNLKVNYIMPKVAEGIFTFSDVPKGDFSITPPVFFGKNVQIEKGCQIGPNTIILDNALVSSDTALKNTILLEDCFVSSDCFIDDALVFKNVSIRKNSAVMCNSKIGENAIIGENTLVESNSVVLKNEWVDIKNNAIKYIKNNEYGGFYGFTVNEAALFGEAAAIVLSKSKIGVLYDGSIESLPIKLAVISGLMTGGAECFDFGMNYFSNLFFLMDFCNIENALYISKACNGVVITVVEKNGADLSSNHYYRIKDKIKNLNKSKQITNIKIKNIRQIKGLEKLYVQKLSQNFNKKTIFPKHIFCENLLIENLINSVIKNKGLKNTDDNLIFYIDNRGIDVKAQYFKDEFTKESLLNIVKYYNDLNQNDIDLNLVEKDGVYLCFTVIDILNNTKKDLKYLCEKSTKVFVAQKNVDAPKKLTKTLERLSDFDDISVINNEINFKDYDVKIKFYNEGDIKKLKVLSRAETYYQAQEIVGEISKLL